MHRTPAVVLLIIASYLSNSVGAAQSLSVDRKGLQTFNLKDERGRNQAIFTSRAAIEDISGTASGLSGTVSFDPANVQKTISADIAVDVNSMKTGIDMRDGHMRGEGWLNAKQYPTITFHLSRLENVKLTGGTQIDGTAVGDFTMHGVTKQMQLPVTMVYMAESEKTRQRAPGDLLVVRAKGSVRLSDFGITNSIIGQKVAEEIAFEFNAVGSNAVR